jgi:cytochrome c-type biogenesis protein CcmF
MLYLGYVGMVVPFGIAAGALLRGELGASWMVPLRKWVIIPWTFLSVGIILGSWWAYAVLGWGGYWAWDPVENASFLPWLTATAFLHSTMVLERKGMLKLWTLALALASFWLTIVGTFMTRSGVFNSVHSFTQSDIGPTFLVFIALIMIFSIGLLASRGHLLVADQHMNSVVSREGSILVNNLIFVAITFTVFCGTVYPLVMEAMSARRISVGEPYFNTMALPGGLLVLFLMGVGPMLPWGETNASEARRQMLLPTAAGVAVAGWCALAGYRGFMPLLTFGLAGFAVLVTLRELFIPARALMAEQQGPLQALIRSASRAPRRFGGYIVHLGIVVIIVAIAASSSYKVHSTGTLTLGKEMEVGGYKVRFDGLSSGKEPHREWTAANISIISPAGDVSTLVGKEAPRMNFYERQTDPVGSPAVQEKIFKDVYVSLLAFDPAAKTASFNAWIFPMVGWIWYSIPILVLGSLISFWPQRRREAAVAAAAPGAGAPPPPPVGGPDLTPGTP